MAQPLTILRGALGVLQLSERVATEDRRYLEMSVAQIGRLCDMMTNLRNLLNATEFDPVCTQVDLGKLAGLILEEYAAASESSGVRMKAVHPDRPAFVSADAARTEQALRAALDTALGLAAHGDEIGCRILPDGFVLQNEHLRGKALSSSDRLALSLVEVAIRSQRGRYRLTEDPFLLAVRLPSAMADITSECWKEAV